MIKIIGPISIHTTLHYAVVSQVQSTMLLDYTAFKYLFYINGGLNSQTPHCPTRLGTELIEQLARCCLP